MRPQSLALPALLVLASAAVAGTTRVVAGGVSGRWTEAGSPYIVEGNVTVAKGQSLEIGPRVRVYFAGPYSITVHGLLKVRHSRDHWKDRLGGDDPTTYFTTNLTANPAGWGGLRFVHSDPRCGLENCIIENARTATGGGGIYVEEANLSLANCTVRHNESAGPGGGMAAVNSTVALANVTVTGNTSGGAGGGIYLSGGTVSAANVTVERNTGGGIYAIGCRLHAANLTVSENRGNGLALAQNSAADLANCTVTNNRGAERGGGILCLASQITAANLTVSGNAHGGIYAGDNATGRLVSSRLTADEGEPFRQEEGSDVSLTNCFLSE